MLNIRRSNNILLCSLFFLTALISSNVWCNTDRFIIVGSGMAGAMEAYHAFLDAKKNNQSLCITMYEQNKSLGDTTVSNIAPSLTPDEILSVVPRGQELVKKIQILFSEPGGIRVDDVRGIQGTRATEQFQQQAQLYSMDEVGHNQRTQCLLELGKMSMDMWQKLYEDADAELKEILKSSNFNACYEPTTKGPRSLCNGYRIDLIYNVSNAKARALSMKQDYESLGYNQCALLTPDQVTALDPFLADFCNAHSTKNNGQLEWNHDAIALWRPGGCLDAQVFLPKLYAYLTKHMGTYTNAQGKIENRFQIKFGTKITGLDFAHTNNGQTIISQLHAQNGQTVNLVDQHGATSQCVFCPGESVGTMKNLGLQEPAYAGFAGASLMFTIDIPKSKMLSCAKFRHCMEVHQEGVVLAWQARFRDNKIFIAVAGTKAFYSDRKPNKNEDFAKNRNLLQLNMVNDVLPEFISWALERDTKGQTLTERDLSILEDKGIVTRWAGTRAVVYDGFPTLGCVYTQDHNKIANARCTTHLGSGGVSFAPAAIAISRSAFDKQDNINSFAQTVLRYADSTRSV